MEKSGTVSQCMEPVKDNQGNLTQFVIQVIDITDRKTAEESLKQPKKHFSGISHKLSDPERVTDPGQ